MDIFLSVIGLYTFQMVQDFLQQSGCVTSVDQSSAEGMSFVSMQQKMAGRKHGRSCFGGLLSKIVSYNFEQTTDWHRENIIYENCSSER